MNSPRKLLIFFFFLLLIPVYWIAICAPAVGIYHDDGIYLVTVKALAEGKGYRIISLPDEIIQTKYPILFPSLLLFVWKIFPNFPDNSVYLKMVPMFGTFFWMVLFRQFMMRRSKNPDVSIWIILITLASPWIVFFSATILSETVFACFCMWALILFHKLEVNKNGKNELHIILYASIATASAFLTRTAGVPLIFAGTISLLIRRKYLSGLKFFLLCTILISPWLYWQVVHNSTSNIMNTYYSSSNYINWNILLNYSQSQKVDILALNIILLLIAPIRLLSITHVNLYSSFVLMILFTGFFLVGFLQDFRKGIKFIHIFIIIYYGMLLLWVWPPIRFIVPIFPIWLFYVHEGFMNVSKKLPINNRKLSIMNVCLIMILILILSSGLYRSSIKTRSTKQVSIELENKSNNYNWMELSSLLNWIRENTPEDSVLLGNLDPTYYLYTGRKAVRGFVLNPYLLYYHLNDSEESVGKITDLLKIIIDNKVNYIILSPNNSFKEDAIFARLFNNFSAKYKNVVHLVKEGTVPGYQIYWVDQNVLQFISQNS